MRFLLSTLTALALGLAAHATTITVNYSEDFAEQLAEDYGEREGPYLAEEVMEDVQRELDRRGIDVPRIDITIEAAKPNRPTMEQISDRPGLDPFRSISIGGMDLSATAYGEDGAVLMEFQYDWFENDIRNVRGASTWWDAKRASSRFARRFAEALAER